MEKIITKNRKAIHDYHILESFEAGIVLTGTEVKSLREGRANLKDAYARIVKGELYITGVHISPYNKASRFNHDPERERKLLVNHRELKRLYGKLMERGLTLVPLRLYFKDSWAKVELGLVKGKKQYDRRTDIEKREAQIKMKRAMKRSYGSGN